MLCLPAMRTFAEVDIGAEVFRCKVGAYRPSLSLSEFESESLDQIRDSQTLPPEI